MIGDPPTDGTNWLLIAKGRFMKALPLRFEEKKENVLGMGGYGVVYRGTFEGNAVAVKVYSGDSGDEQKKQEQKREIEAHLRLDHENVLKLLHVDDSRAKTCLVLELCAGTIRDYCDKKYDGPELPPDGIVLYQIANGLHYVHSQDLVHRDVKPDNILISITTPVQIKLSDFKFVKKISPQGTFTQSGLKGTLNWMAPEILELFNDDGTTDELPRGTIQSDTFAGGCVFFYFLTRGKHPFGNSMKIPANILDDNPIELKKANQNLQGDDRALYELIGEMIKPKEQRIKLPKVIEQLTAKLYATRQFKKSERSMSEGGKFAYRFHPTKPVLACGIEGKVIFFNADNSSIPFSNWKEEKIKLKIENIGIPETIEWNADGTQLAVTYNGDVIVWNYRPTSSEILFRETKLKKRMDQIGWNPFRSNVFAIFNAEFVESERVVFLFNSCPVDQRQFHFYTIECEKEIASVQWISENRVALGLDLGGGIEIWEIDESTTSAIIVKRLEHEGLIGFELELAWNERTKCLAAFSLDGWMTIWSMDSDQPIHAQQMQDACYCLAWRPNGKQMDDEGVDAARKYADNFILVGGLADDQIVVWTPMENEKTKILSRQHSKWVTSLSFSPDGRFLASADSDGKVIIWSTENWQPVYIDKAENWIYQYSWLSSFTEVPHYKLAFHSLGDKVRVVEYAVGQSEKPIKD